MNPAILTHPDATVLAERLTPFLAADALSELAVHAADTLARHANEHHIDVLLACALAVHAPSRGHVCLQLDSVQRDDLVSEGTDADAVGALTLPADRSEWRRAIHSSPLTAPGGPFVLDGPRLYTARYHRYESALASALASRLTRSRDVAFPELLKRGLAALFTPQSDVPEPDWQKVAAAVAVLRGVTVISGGPGTGKTHTVSRVLTLLWAQWRAAGGDGLGPRVALAAPTGKAAARMSEAIQNSRKDLLTQCGDALPEGATARELSEFLDTLQPTTLHRLLGFQPFDPTRFKHHAGHPLPHDIILVDEASMVDVALMNKLVTAIGPQARLILLGDKNQLASVEAGTVLADVVGPSDGRPLSEPALSALAQVGVAVPEGPVGTPGAQDGIVQLVHSRRFHATSGIGHVAAACLAGASADDTIATMNRHDDVSFIQHTGRGQLPEYAMTELLDILVPAVRKAFDEPAIGTSRIDHHRSVLAAFESVRVLAAHRRGRLGVQGLNQAIAGALAERIGDFDPSARHYLGQPILVRRNDPVVGRYNGDVGIIVRDEQGRLTTAFPAEGGVEYLAPARLPEHQTVFAMTIHKSQGSEFQHAMVVLPEDDSPLLSRELLYTGVTRAKQRLTVVASPAVLHAALQRTVNRSSGLAELLWRDA